MAYTDDILGLIEETRDIALGGDPVVGNVPRTEYHLLRHLATILGADLSDYPDDYHGALTAIRDVLGGTGDGPGAGDTYTNDSDGLLLEIRDIVAAGDPVTSYPGGELGCWQAIRDFSVANGFGSTVTDDFNRAGPGLGANWTALDSNVINIASSTKAAPSVVDNHCVHYWNADVFEDDQFAECTVTDITAASFVGLVLRAQSSGVNYYVCYYGSNNALALYKWTVGSAASLHSEAIPGGAQVGDVFRVEVSGLNFTAKVNGATILEWTDVLASPFTSGSPGLSLYGSVATFAGADDWSAGPTT